MFCYTRICLLVISMHMGKSTTSAPGDRAVTISETKLSRCKITAVVPPLVLLSNKLRCMSI